MFKLIEGCVYLTMVLHLHADRIENVMFQHVSPTCWLFGAVSKWIPSKARVLIGRLRSILSEVFYHSNACVRSMTREMLHQTHKICSRLESFQVYSFIVFVFTVLLGRIISNRFIPSKIAGFIYFFFQSKIFETSITTRQAIELIIQIGISRSNDNVITNRIQNISKPWFVTWFGLFVVFINWIYVFFKLSYIFTYEKDGIHNIIYSYTIESSQCAKPSPYIDSLRIMKILQFRESMNFK